MNTMHRNARLTAFMLALGLAGCAAVGPSYQRPAVDTPVAFKEGPGAWVPATPADTLERGPWWELFGDPVLNALAQRVALDNQNVAQSVAAYAQADLLGVERNRAQLEHAIAVLVGVAPASFSLPAEATWSIQLAAVPVTVPSTLLQRRPDIAAAERRVAAANQQIGIAVAGYYPSLSLNGSAGLGAATIGELFSASSLVWSLGVQLAQTLFNGGLTGARVDAARAAQEAAAARYRQTVLGAFQQVEDQLVASRVLGQQQALREQASQAADLVEQQVLNRYQAGQVSYTEVITHRHCRRADPGAKGLRR